MSLLQFFLDFHYMYKTYDYKCYHSYNLVCQGLSDENEFVRDTALHAGKRIINQYAEMAIELLLPELEKGLFDDNWRIRNSSVQLLGDLLYKVSGEFLFVTYLTLCLEFAKCFKHVSAVTFEKLLP